MDAGMAFAIIFALIMIGMILVFGIGQIGNIFCLSSDAQVASSIKDLDSMVDQVYALSEGSSRLYDLALPGDARFCFVNTTSPEIPAAYTEEQSRHDWKPDPVYSAEINESGYNLWYQQCSGWYGYAFKNLRVQNGKSFCVDSGDSLYLVNKGRFVEVSFR